MLAEIDGWTRNKIIIMVVTALETAFYLFPLQYLRIQKMKLETTIRNGSRR